MLTHYLNEALTSVLTADPTPTPTGTPTGGGDGHGILNTNGILKFALQYVVPLGLAMLGCTAIFSHARKGEMGKIMTSTTIALIGIALIAGAGTLYVVGDNIVDTVIPK